MHAYILSVTCFCILVTARLLLQYATHGLVRFTTYRIPPTTMIW